MRPAMLLIPLAAAFAGAWAAGALRADAHAHAPIDEDMRNAIAAADAAIEAAVNEAEAAANAAMNAAAADATDPANDAASMAAPRPAWTTHGTWLVAAEEADGAVWWLDVGNSDLVSTPHRVILRTDESRVAGARYGNTERRTEVDCAARTYHVYESSRFDGPPDEPLTLTMGDPRTIRPEPGSIWARVVDSVCAGASQDDNASNVMNAM